MVAGSRLMNHLVLPALLSFLCFGEKPFDFFCCLRFSLDFPNLQSHLAACLAWIQAPMIPPKPTGLSVLTIVMENSPHSILYTTPAMFPTSLSASRKSVRHRDVILILQTIRQTVR